jgi:hypothetical protein
LPPEPPGAEPAGDCVHPDVLVAPFEPAVCPAVVPVAPELLASPGEDPGLDGEPVPSAPPPPDDCPPVSTVELTWTIVALNVGTPSAMAAMNATPASTLTGRSQLAPSGPEARRRSRPPCCPVFRERVASVPPAGSRRDQGRVRELGRGSALSRGKRSGQAQ